MPTEQRAVGGFERVVLRDVGVLDVGLGAEEELSVEADANVLPRVLAEVQNGVLTLRLAKDWRDRIALLGRKRPPASIHYRLKVKRLSGLVIADRGRATLGEMRSPQLELELSGSGKINCKMLSVERLTVKLSGAGDVVCQALKAQLLEVVFSGAGKIELAGSVESQRVEISGAGNYDAGGLESQEVHVSIPGAGNAKVWAAQSLEAKVSGMGMVEYYGSPNLHKKVSGVANIHELGVRGQFIAGS